MSIYCREPRIPPAVRMCRALRVAAEEVCDAPLVEIIALAEQIARLNISVDFALDWLRIEGGDYDLDNDGDTMIVKRRNI